MTTLEENLLKNMSELCKKQGGFPFLEAKAQVITPKCWVWTNTVGLLTCWCECRMSWGSVLWWNKGSVVQGRLKFYHSRCCRISAGLPDREIWAVAGHEICLNW